MFEVHQTDQGTFDITEDGRAFRYDLVDIEECEAEIRTWNGKVYIFIHPDGYQEEREL